MLVKFRVLLPKWVFENSLTDEDVQANTINYMQRYPHYVLIKIENGFAICDRIN